MRADVLPWLESHVAVSAEDRERTAAEPHVPRFTVVFGREGYSPDLFAELRQQRIAALTYQMDRRRREYDVKPRPKYLASCC
jgi:hypothetical protein